MQLLGDKVGSLSSFLQKTNKVGSVVFELQRFKR